MKSKRSLQRVISFRIDAEPLARKTPCGCELFCYFCGTRRCALETPPPAPLIGYPVTGCSCALRKTGVPVFIPLPGFVVEALDDCPRKSERYWFWTGEGSKETVTGNWRRTFRRLCAIADVTGGHPHRFRDTLAVELLMEGVPMERVSILLGHSSVKITERHYAP